MTHPLPVGSLVRHWGQQYPSAYEGTATVAVAVPCRDGRTFEYLVYHHANGNPCPPSWWNSDATIPMPTPAPTGSR